MTIPTIPEFFFGRNVFITGGTGFIGKILIEKLLRSCPDVGKIYVLVRLKKNRKPEERIKAITDTPLFDRLKFEAPDALNKIVVVEGDMMELELGLSKRDRNILLENVAIVFHVAATVRFNEALGTAIIMNTRGTREVCNLVLEMKKAEVLAHVSTAYCNIDGKIINERLYPPVTDWRKTIEVAENTDQKELTKLSHFYVGNFPNTYTFTKSLAEHVVNDLCGKRIATVILRPTIVVSTWQEPIPGWMDNFNGAVGFITAVGKGIAPTFYGCGGNICDLIPADIVVKTLIGSVWEKACAQDVQDRLDVTYYNCSFYRFCQMSTKEFIGIVKRTLWTVPLENMFWTHCNTFYSNKVLHYIFFVLFHLLPAFFIDLLQKIIGGKPMLLMVQRKLYQVNMSLHYFLSHQWIFLNNNMFMLLEKLLPADRENFSYSAESFVLDNYIRSMLLGIKKYLFGESEKNMDAAKRKAFFLYCLHVFLKYSFFLVIGWIVLQRVFSYVSIIL